MGMVRCLPTYIPVANKTDLVMFTEGAANLSEHNDSIPTSRALLNHPFPVFWDTDLDPRLQTGNEK